MWGKISKYSGLYKTNNTYKKRIPKYSGLHKSDIIYKIFHIKISKKSGEYNQNNFKLELII